MAYAAKLYNSTQTLDMTHTTTKYKLGDDFIPPAAVMEASLTSGLSANIYGGAIKTNEKYQNRDWTFTVLCFGASEQEVIGNSNSLVNILRRANDTSDPLKFGYRPNADIPAPLWGQFGAWHNYEVVHASYAVTGPYTQGRIRQRVVSVQVNLNVKPLAEGQQQRVASAAGGIFEDVIGSADGVSAGVRIPEATTNKSTNPVFGNATYTTGWTAQANLVVTKNTDPQYLFPGAQASAKVVCTNTSANNTIYQTLAAGNTNAHSISAVLMKQDGSAITSSDFNFYYNGGLTPTIESMGNGRYLAYYNNVTGVVAATAAGITILKASTPIYILAFQFEEKAAHTPICTGDMLGCAWSSTAHASTSTRTAGTFRVAVGVDTINRAAGSVAVVWKTPGAWDTISGNRVMFSAGANVITSYFQTSDKKIILTDSTTTISTAAQTFASGDVLRLIYTWGNSGLNIYQNGANAATSANYAVPDISGNLTFGASNGLASYANGLFPLLQTYDHELTSTEVTAIDAELSALITAGKRPAPTPWLWTKDGDNVLDNCDDSTRDNWCVIGGVDGNLPAKYYHNITVGTTKNSYWLGGIDLPNGVFIYPTYNWYNEQSGSADANASGGEIHLISSGASPTGKTMSYPSYGYGKFNFFARIYKPVSSGSLSIKPRIVQGYQVVLGDSKTISVDTTSRIYYAGTLMNVNPIESEFRKTALANDDIYFSLDYTSSIDTNLDYIHVIPGRLAQFIWDNTRNATNIVYNGETANGFSVSALVNYGNIPVVGDPLYIIPNRYNLLWGISGAHAEAHVITNTLTFTTFITPRWSLL